MISSEYEIPVFYPTLDEFKDFSAFIASIEARGAHRIGLAKIVPPKEWKARQLGYKHKQIDDKIVENPIKQEVRGRDGVYSVFNIQQGSIKLSSFQKLANSNRYAPPSSLSNDLEKLEKQYWQSLTSNAPIYGADVGGSFYDKDQTVWNICDLGTILDDLATEYGTKIQGVNTPYLYFGMWRASFAWHTEDMDLYSINYLHFGAPKQWYVIPPFYGRKFEQFAATRFPSLARRCPAFLRHKMTIVTPSMLNKQSIPYAKITQYENEFMITFPYSYHAGFNYGFNCAESTNFALERWIEYGKHSIKCTCRKDMVKISMDPFVYKYQPELYEDWCRGINLTPHPEDKIQRKLSMYKSKEKEDKCLIGNRMNFEQIQHQEHIADERYACIFRNLAKFDKQKEYNVYEKYPPLLRAALYRYQYKKMKNSTALKLLCLSANAISQCSFSIFPTFFYGLKQSGKYREHLLDGLWNWQLLNIEIEQKFNQSISQQNSCSICYLFHGNKFLLAIKPCFLFSEIVSNQSNEILICSQCHVTVHRNCYENLCLAMNVQLKDEDNQTWLCQRCLSKRNQQIDDRCTSCLFRGGLLISPEQFENQSFIHGICSIYQAYQTSQGESCHYCWSFCPLNYRKISTHLFATCDYTKCSNTFHITCGLINGCIFDIDQDNGIIHSRCHLHAKTSLPNSTSLIEGNEEILMEVNEILEEEDNFIVEEDKRVPTGTRVLINQTKDHQIGQVIKNEVIYHYSVDFGDETYSHDMLAEDILEADPSKLKIGSDVRIKWTDGTIYTCKYLGRKRVLLYHIKLYNEIRQMQRNEFSVDIQPPPSPPPTPCEMECEYETSTGHGSLTKRANQYEKPIIKRKRRRLLICSSSSDDES